jgi:hypothetical protein
MKQVNGEPGPQYYKYYTVQTAGEPILDLPSRSGSEYILGLREPVRLRSTRPSKPLEVYDVTYTVGVLSERIAPTFRRWLGPALVVERPVEVDGRPFFFFAQLEEFDWIDRTRSELVPFSSDPDKFMRAIKLRFRDDLIGTEPRMFSLTRLGGLYMTAAAARELKSLKAKGAKMQPVV